MMNPRSTPHRRRRAPRQPAQIDNLSDDVPTTTSHTTSSSNDQLPASEVVPQKNNSSAAASKIWSDLPRRLATIIIGFPIVVNMLQYPTLARIFFTGAHAISAYEYALLEPSSSTSMSPTSPTTSERLMFCLISVMLATLPSSSSSANNLFLCALSITVGVFMMLMVSSSTSSTTTTMKGSSPMKYYHWTVGLCLVTVPFRVWTQLAVHDFTSTLSVLLVVWNTDTGALVVGRLFSNNMTRTRRQVLTTKTRPSNRHRVLVVPEWILRISPKKTMEGFLGGLLGGIWTAYAWIPWIIKTFGPTITHSSSQNDNDIDTSENGRNWFLQVDPSPEFRRLWGLSNESEIDQDDESTTTANDKNVILVNHPGLRRLVLGLILAVLAIVGDLVESAIKRRSQSKDSGNVLPGHGGVLDRFDSSLLAVMVYYYVFLLDM